MKHAFITLIMSLALLPCFGIHAIYAKPAPKITAAEQYAVANDEIDRFVKQAMETFAVPGIAVGFVLNGQIVHAKGYGTCKIGEVLPVTERTVFPIASCTKAFTAFLACQLVDEGKLSLDDPVKKYLPELILYDSGLTESLTVRDLLAHRSGIERHDPIWIYSDISRSDVLGLLRHLKPVFGLREKFQYNNFMYALAGIVVEKVSGCSWEECLTSKIFKPLGMHDTDHSIDRLLMHPDHAFPHASLEGGGSVLGFRDLYPVNPCGGINSTVLDMAQWLRLHLCSDDYRHMIASPTMLEMHATQMPFPFSLDESGPLQQCGYGLGWFIGKYRGHRMVSHGGNIDGFASFAALLPDEGIGLVILTNSGDEGDYAIASITRQLFDSQLNEGNEDWSGIMGGKRDMAKLELKQKLQAYTEALLASHPSCDLKDYMGRYQHPSYGNIEVEVEGDHLVIWYNREVFPIYCNSEDVFAGRLEVLLNYGINPVIEIAFIRNEAGVISGMEVPFEKFRNAQPVDFTKCVLKG